MEEPELPNIVVVSVVYEDDAPLRVEVSDNVSPYEALGILRVAAKQYEESVMSDSTFVEEEEEDG